MKVYVVQGMAYGDEGKGLLVDHLTRELGAELVIRFNGGPQAAHNVISPDGIHHHTFSQWGSGTIAGARTFLSKHMLIDPFAIMEEAAVLGKEGIAFQRLAVDPECIIITPHHRFANRRKERQRGKNRHGSVGLGVGEARADALAGLALRVKDVIQGDALPILYEIEKAKNVYEWDLAELERHYIRIFDLGSVVAVSLEEAMRGVKTVVFEGAQGVLLDETYGFPPYNSWTNCTFANAESLLKELGTPPDNITRVGVFRSYFTRHGPGPFVTADKAINVEERHNNLHPWMGPFRQGRFDLVAAKYACEVAKPDVLAITHMDVRPSSHVALEYRGGGLQALPPTTELTEQLMQEDPVYGYLPGELFRASLESALKTPVAYESYGSTSEDVRILDKLP